MLVWNYYISSFYNLYFLLHTIYTRKHQREISPFPTLFPGYGDAVNCEENWKSVERYVDEQFNKFFQDESGLNRKNIQDHRVHCCLYFIPPYGHG